MVAAGAREEVATFYRQSHELATSSSLSLDFMAGSMTLSQLRFLW